MAEIDPEVCRQGIVEIVMRNPDTIDRFMSGGCIARSKVGTRYLSRFSTQFITPNVLRGEK
jgi:hypothetical protein